ncbi:MAG: B12-binding domain-containing radical SAM protein [Phycisphaerae bacterium]
MRVVLVNPPWVVHNPRNIWRTVASVMPPLGLAWLAAALRRAGHQVTILDAHAEQLSPAEAARALARQQPPDLLGLTATTPLIAPAMEIAATLRRQWPATRIVFGGVHPTVLPGEVLACEAVDAVVRGEGERTLVELADGRPPETIDGLSFRAGGQVVHNPDRELIADLDSLGMPAWDLLPVHLYRPAAGAARRLPAVSVLATRGCPGRCTFCYRIFGQRLRCRSGQAVAEEVALLQDRYGIREVCFYDDTFTAVRREVRAFCDAVEQMELDLTWSCFSRVDTFDANLFGRMKAVGCHQVMYGVESGSRAVLESIRKSQDVGQVRDVVRATQKLGLEVRAAFMLGNPGETEQSLRETIRFALELDPDLALFNVATPYPGTEMFAHAEAGGHLRTRDWRKYDLSMPVMDLPTVPAETVVKYYRKAHRRFFLRPRYILKRLRRLRGREDFVSALRGLKTVLGI